jgi:hypothetical protein
MARDLIHELDHSLPAAFHVKLGALLQQIITNQNAILAKLDAGGATVAALGTNNVATLSITDLVTLGQSAS